MTEPNEPNDADDPEILFLDGPGPYEKPAHLTLANIREMFGVTEDGTLLETVAALSDAADKANFKGTLSELVDTMRRDGTHEAFRHEVLMKMIQK